MVRQHRLHQLVTDSFVDVGQNTKEALSAELLMRATFLTQHPIASPILYLNKTNRFWLHQVTEQGTLYGINGTQKGLLSREYEIFNYF